RGSSPAWRPRAAPSSAARWPGRWPSPSSPRRSGSTGSTRPPSGPGTRRSWRPCRRSPRAARPPRRPPRPPGRWATPSARPPPRPGSLLAGAARDTAGLSPAEVTANAAILMFGGIDTTEGMIANAALHLLGHPGQLRLVLDDPGLLPAAIEESLRLEPAAAVVD